MASAMVRVRTNHLSHDENVTLMLVRVDTNKGLELFDSGYSQRNDLGHVIFLQKFRFLYFTFHIH